MPNDEKKEQTCRVCGCTNDKPCPGGWHWVEIDLCSECKAPPEKPIVKKRCPFMSRPYPASQTEVIMLWVDCPEEKCAMWNMVVGECSI